MSLWGLTTMMHLSVFLQNFYDTHTFKNKPPTTSNYFVWSQTVWSWHAFMVCLYLLPDFEYLWLKLFVTNIKQMLPNFEYHWLTLSNTIQYFSFISLIEKAEILAGQVLMEYNTNQEPTIVWSQTAMAALLSQNQWLFTK